MIKDTTDFEGVSCSDPCHANPRQPWVSSLVLLCCAGWNRALNKNFTLKATAAFMVGAGLRNECYCG